MHKIKSLLLLLVLYNLTFAEPPKPPVGKRWVLNPDFSDEFNGTSLDTSKWLDYHPTWKGREPGLFMPSQISVKDGYMQIRGEKMDKDTIVGKQTFNVKCGAVVSKKTTFFGYYECRAKAAATTMSTTFWFSSDHYKGPNKCDSYHLEWDIHESIGRGGDFTGKYFAYGMHANSHFWYNDCNGKRNDHRAQQVRFENEEESSKRFHVYGGWLRDESSASLYYDNGEGKHQKFYDKVMEKPFNQPLYMRLVSETYPFPWIELPTDEELADTTKNTVYYDWVRSYQLVDVNTPSNLKPEQQVNIYSEGVFFNEAVIEMKADKSLKIPLTYKANKDREIKLVLFDLEDKKIKDVVIPAYSGYANMEFELKFDNAPGVANGYKLVSNLIEKNGDKKNILDTNTLFINLTE